MKEPTDQHDLDLNTSLCEVCGYRANGQTYGFFNCNGCKLLMLCYFRSKEKHSPCCVNQHCIISKDTRLECRCCHLKKCVSRGMDPYYSLRKQIITDNPIDLKEIEPKQWFFLLSCETCDSESIQAINESIEVLKSWFMQHKKERDDSTVGEESTLSRCEIENGKNKLNFYDSAAYNSTLSPIPDRILIERNSYHSEPTPLNTNISERFPICTSNQNSTSPRSESPPPSEVTPQDLLESTWEFENRLY